MIQNVSIDKQDGYQYNGLEIAIIGMAGRFPGASSIDKFRQNLRNGVESVSFFSNEDLVAEGISTQYLNDPKYIKAKGVLEDIELFDASYFGYTPKEAKIMDPQHRIFLECAVEAIENAGYHSDIQDRLIGVYAGAGMNTYLLKNLYSNPEFIESVDEFDAMIGNDKDFLTTKVSYKLNFEGPSVAVQTACSTSLVAVCMACQSLLSGECDMALAGGVSINLPQKGGYLYQEGGILSPDGHCRAFDAKAQGTAFSSAAGIVVLKRLEDALNDKDSIYAVIKGSAVNNDGSFKIGFTAPRVDGQAKAIKAALTMAEIDPSTISYIEAHGTGTPLGDPIEVAALNQVFGGMSSKKKFCAIGSVKTNIGHADAAAGITGLIKTVLMLKHKEIPPSLYFESANPKIDFENSPFYVNRELKPWIVNGHPRRAGVSSFGIGGTNAHVVLEEAPPVEQAKPSRPWQLVVLSAKTATALDSMTSNFRRYLEQNPNTDLDDGAYTLQVGRKVYPYRRIFVCRGREDAIAALSSPSEKRWVDAVQTQVKWKPVFMFSGQGAQYVHMGATLYRDEPIFREYVDRCSQILEPMLGKDLRTILYPDEKNRADTSEQLCQTSMAQIALFVIEYSLAQLWMAWGVKPDAMVGHSIGEYVAACLAGVFTLENGLSVVCSRGRMMQQCPKGGMLAVALSELDIKPFLDEQISLAAVNGPSHCVVSGTVEAIEALTKTLAKKKIVGKLLHTSHAFHSHMMTPIIEEFTTQVSKVPLNAPNIPFVSNVTGTWIRAEQATDPSYWARHLRQTVRFGDAIKELSKDKECLLLEVGPGNTLATFARQFMRKSDGPLVLSSLRHPKEHKSDTALILDTLGRLWLAGIQLNWTAFNADSKRTRICLPTYPFERKRYWVEPKKVNASRNLQEAQVAKIADLSQWLYIPDWIKAEEKRSASFDGEKIHSRWLFFADKEGLASELLYALKKDGHETTTVVSGKRFLQIGQNDFEINPNKQEDYIELVRRLRHRNSDSLEVVHLWSFGVHDEDRGTEYFEYMQGLGYYSLIFLCKAFEYLSAEGPISIQIIADRVHRVLEHDRPIPEKATILGPCKVIPQEYANINCRLIDVPLEGFNSPSMQDLSKQLYAELTAECHDAVVAYREGRRWLPTFNKLSRTESSSGGARTLPGKLKRQGVYLITGGLGNVGMVIAEYLANSVQAKLILTGRSEFPHPVEWQGWLDTHDKSDSTRIKIEKLKALLKKGSEVLIIKADVSNETEMGAALDLAEGRFGGLNGIIHAAGIVDAAVFRFIQELDQNASEMHFLAKVHGLYVLEKLLRGKQIDFCMVVSSLASILGGLGYAAYAAGNAFMDAFVEKRRKIDRVPWISVNWDAWKFSHTKHKGMGAAMVELGITPKEGNAVLNMILLQEEYSRILVSTTDLEKRIRQWIRGEATNKISATAVGNLLTLPQADSKPYRSYAEDQVEQTIIEIWKKLLGIDEIDVNDDFFELGGSSLTALRLFAEIEKIYKKKISLANLIKGSTVSQLAMLLKRSNYASDWNSLVAFRKHGSNPPIFLVHGAEGNILLYRELAYHLGTDQPVYGLQSQGLDGRLVVYHRIEEIAAHYISEIRTVRPQGPYFLGGYCMGGVIAYEMAQQLFAQGQFVGLLALFETYNPQLGNSSVSFLHRSYQGLQNLQFHFENIKNIKGVDKVKFLRKKVQVEAARTKDVMGAGMWKIAELLTLKKIKRHHPVSVKEINDQAYFAYKPKTFPGRITLFRPIKFFNGANDPHFGWNGLAQNGLNVFDLPVNPRGMLVEPFVQTLAGKLLQCIEESAEKESWGKNQAHARVSSAVVSKCVHR